jgi:hypothetical protein
MNRGVVLQVQSLQNDLATRLSCPGQASGQAQDTSGLSDVINRNLFCSLSIAYC